MTVIVALGDQDASPVLDVCPDAKIVRIPRASGDTSEATAEEIERALRPFDNDWWYVVAPSDAAPGMDGAGWTYDERLRGLGLSGCTLEKLTTRTPDPLPSPSVIIGGDGPSADIVAREVVRAIGNPGVVYEPR